MMQGKLVSKQDSAVRRHSKFLILISIVLIMVLAACQSATPTPTKAPEEPTTAPQATVEPTVEVMEDPALTPSVTVEDQALEDGTVIISEVISDGQGWIVIHADLDGAPGAILGYTQVDDGMNNSVTVDIDTSIATDVLYAMLHTDSGEIGVWEFPDGPDTPVKVNDVVVTPAFELSKQVDGDEITLLDETILLGGNDAYGPFLTASDGMTLYYFTRDEPGMSNCYDACAENWPPLLIEEGQSLTAADGVAGALGTVEREDGTTQVTYNDIPLYYWINDSTPGDATGHGVRGVWAVVGVDTIVYNLIPDESKVTYEVNEVFLDDNRFATAVGVTGQVEGKILLDLANPQAALIAPITVDISQFASDSSRRDNKIRTDFLESETYPIGTFVPTEIIGLPEEYTLGDQIDIQITGDMTIREVTQSVTFDTTVQFNDGVLSGEAYTTILMSDFGFGPISILGILETEDEVKLTFDFVAKP